MASKVGDVDDNGDMTCEAKVSGGMKVSSSMQVSGGM